MNEKTTSQKIVIVTGASSGIGTAITRLFAENGYVVLAAGRDAKRLDDVAGQCDGVTPWVGDLTTEEACDRLIEDCIRQFGRLDVLINNAGIYIRGDATETSADDWRKTLAVNLDAPFFLSKASIPHLRKSKGAIINIASDWGLQGGKRAAAYCASKGGIVLLTKGMALDHAAEGIRVNAVCPGDVDTPMLANEAISEGMTYLEALQKYGADSPTGRVTHAGEVAGLVLYLASEQAVQITGAAISIDGGNTA
jgi:meso-butanediol dehydrogenase/(S,S)-butanediol dehydrogenase/diacetyl reductase